MELKYCLYARKSTESDERQAMSIDSQINEMLATADRAGIVITDIKRESHSAKKSASRPIFLELINEIAIGKYDAILTWAPDRLSRNAGDLGSLVDLMDAGKLQEIRTYGQSFRNTPNEKFLLMILCSQAKLENDNRGLTIKRGMRARAALGWRPGNIPIGYLNRSIEGRKDIIPDLERADVIKEIFARVAEQKQTGRQIKKWLDDINFRTKRDCLLSLSQIYKVLDNTFYYGEYEYPKGGEIRLGTHEPLVTKELFLAARSSINEQRRSQTEWGSKKLPFRKMFTCRLCGNTMTVEDNRKYVYFRCSGYSKEKGRCGGKSLTLKEIDKQVIKAMNRGDIKRSSFLPTFNNLVDQHYRITKTIMNKQGHTYVSTTRLRDYILHIFKNGTIDEKQTVFNQLKHKPSVADGELIFNAIKSTTMASL